MSWVGPGSGANLSSSTVSLLAIKRIRINNENYRCQSDCLQPGTQLRNSKVTTENGIYGLGDATLNGRELAVAGYLSEHVIPLLIGRDARRIEDIWQYLYKGAYWRRGPVTMCSIGAVDTA